jgi:ring-1,2-phenylacetyl-CoA epoxidase subunit PaaD
MVTSPPITRATPDAGQAKPAVQRAWRVLAEVADPEIPVLSILDLGIVRSVEARDDTAVRVALSPTYTGCPATAVIKASVVVALREAGFEEIVIDAVLSPPWSSDWITEEGRRKLLDYGIAPPAQSVSSVKALFGDPHVACPRCSSQQTERVSEFGSTPCKALYRCSDCREPFDYFKCI